MKHYPRSVYQNPEKEKEITDNVYKEYDIIYKNEDNYEMEM